MMNEARSVPTPVFDIIIALFQQTEQGIINCSTPSTIESSLDASEKPVSEKP